MKEYFIYYGTIILAAIFAGLSQKYATDKENTFKLNKLFFWLSIATLTITMGFRISGLCIDDGNYSEIFNYTKEGRMWEYFIQTKIEPGYLVLNWIVSLFSDSYQAIIFITSIIPIILFYKAIEYERKNVNLFLTVFLFGTVMYMYFYGITRLFIAASIIAYSYRYIFEKKTKKFLISVLIAGLFHYSALFMLVFLYFTTEKEDKPRNKKKFIIIVSVVMLIASLAFVNVIVPALGSSKYKGYSADFNFTLSLGDFDKLIFVFLALLFRKQLKEVNPRIDMYIVMFILATVVTVYSNFIDIGRLQWYLMFSICVILSTLARAILKTDYKNFVVMLVPLIIIYGVIYTYRIVFVQSTNKSMRNYSNILFLEKEE